jgi:hypothetical protein
VSHGPDAPGRAHDRGGDGGRERGGEARAEALNQQTLTAELLKPGADALTKALNYLDAAKAVLFVVAGGVVLVLAGAKLERHLMKQRLQVLDGTEPAYTDVPEAKRGDRA